jgi:hypothetical protein
MLQQLRPEVHLFGHNPVKMDIVYRIRQMVRFCGMRQVGFHSDVNLVGAAHHAFFLEAPVVRIDPYRIDFDYTQSPTFSANLMESRE